MKSKRICELNFEELTIQMPRFGRRAKKSKKRLRNWSAPQYVQSIPRVNAFPLTVARRASYEQQWRFHNGPATNGVAPTQVLRLNLNSIFSHPYQYENGLNMSPAPGVNTISSYAQIAPLNSQLPRPFPNVQGISSPAAIAAFPHHPAGIFDQPTSPGNLYQKYCVIGTKITLVFVPDAPDLTGQPNQTTNTTDPDYPAATMAPAANQCAPSMIGVNYQYNGYGADWITQSTKWEDLKDRPQTKAVRVEGNYGLGGDKVENNKTGKQAAMVCSFTPRQAYTYDSINDAEELWGQTGKGTVPGFTADGIPAQSLITQPDKLATASIFLTQLFPHPNHGAVSGVLQLKVEKTIVFKDPFVSTDNAIPAQADAQANQAAGGTVLPQSTLWRAGSTLGAAASMAATFIS